VTDLNSSLFSFYGYLRKKNPIEDITQRKIITKEKATLFTLPNTKAEIKFPNT
jgi:hypothetical protein